MKSGRINLIFCLFFLCAAIIVARLVFLQLINGHLYRAWAKGQQEIFQQISGQRGEIFLYDKEKLALVATNKAWSFCYVSPKIIEDKEKVAQSLSAVLGLDKKTLLADLSSENNKESLFLLVKRKLSVEEAKAVKDLNVEGVYLGEEPLRIYPYNSLASDILGFVNKEGIGQYGIEGYWNDILTGQESWQKAKYGPFGLFLDSNGLSSRGADLVLTIDRNIQEQTEKVLEEFFKKFGYKTAQIIVMAPKDGRILALADFPNFNPNQYDKYASREETALFQNGAVQSLYEPGSIFKAVTMAAALNEKSITPETKYTDLGYVIVSGEKIMNYADRIWGEKTMTEVLERSINTGAVFAESQLGHNSFLEYLDRFGFFEKTDVGLQGEVYSENKEFKKGYDVNFATASFGQGIEITLIQIARAYCAIANGGRLVQPYIVEGTIKDGKEQEIKREEAKQILSQETSSALVKMLVSVTENGYSKTARVPGYYVAGKTGTSQMPYSVLGIKKSGYSDQTWQSFVGFAPAFDAKFVIAIKLDFSQTKEASESVTFMFQDLAKYILDYYQIPSERPIP